MAKKKKKTELSSEGKTELAKAIAEKSQNFAKTYADVENKIAIFFRWLSGWLDKLLFNQKHGKFVAFVLALFFYVMISFGQNFNLGLTTSTPSRDLGTYSIKPNYSSEAYELNFIDSKDKEVQITAIGELTDLNNIKQQNGLKVVANLSELTEGTHSVKLEVENVPNRVKILLEPSTVTVEIKKKNIRRFTLGYDFINKAKMDSVYDLGTPQLEEGEVYVRASKETLDKIAYVKALIKVDKDVTTDFETTAEIAAYDQDGRKMENVDIIPSTMKASVKVTKPSKDVPITLVPTGTVPNGKAIESYTLDHDTITLYGKQEILNNVLELPISIPASTLTSDKEMKMPVNLINGISKTSIDIVTIKITLADMKEKEIKDVPIKFKNEVKGLSYKISDSSKAKVTVTLKGAQKVIDEIKAEDINVFVDVSKLDKSGTFKDLPLSVEGKNKLVTYELKDATVQLSVEGSVVK